VEIELSKGTHTLTVLCQ